MRPTRPLASILALLAACGLSDPRDPPAPVIEPVPLAGTFDVTSRFDVPATVAAPGPLGDALRLVHGLATDPGTALLDLAEAAGVPALAELRLLLPDSLEAELAGWMNGHLETATVGGVSPHDQLAELDALVRSVLLSFELRSTLDLPAGAPGTHAPTALAFGSPAGPVVVPVGATAPVTSGVDVAGAVSWPDGPAGGARASISDHFMGIPYGRYALQGLEAILQDRYGASSLASVLGGMVGCPGVAASVAGRCVGPLCVGHEAELLAVCQGGVAEGAARLEAQVLALDFQAMRFRAGAATPEGTLLPAALHVSALRGGVWTATIDLGNGAEAAVATFTAVR